ncbi:MAG: hypothetical protein JO110_17215 [Acetobacteraceae bacterium]|nr:hypothetical protein [Acetobacteraceae bacterium]
MQRSRGAILANTPIPASLHVLRLSALLRRNVHGIYRALALVRWARERNMVAAVPYRPEQRAAESENLKVTLAISPAGRDSAS